MIRGVRQWDGSVLYHLESVRADFPFFRSDTLTNVIYSYVCLFVFLGNRAKRMNYDGTVVFV